ncbi:protein of unknown function [Rhodovastum atsumiense]|nr:protein of unknown function [Rhodovastum atsumiense]
MMVAGRGAIRLHRYHGAVGCTGPLPGYELPLSAMAAGKMGLRHETAIHRCEFDNAASVINKNLIDHVGVGAMICHGNLSDPVACRSVTPGKSGLNLAG